MNSLHLRLPPTALRVDLVTDLTFLRDPVGLHDQLHATRFAGSIFSIAVLSEVAPFPVATLKSMLVEEAHFCLYTRQQPF